jgi:tRNA1(Val) A37 N6-methylase TrmN6
MPSDVEAPQGSMETTEDAFLGGKLMIAQPVHGSRAGLDAVFLAAACPAKAGEKVLDAGAGSGIVALAIARRVEGVDVAGVEIDADLCELARRNALRNGLADRVTFHCGDVGAPLSQLFALGLAPDSFDHAVANPPFLEAGAARLPPAPMLSRAHHASAAGELESWVKCLAAFVKPRGTVTIVHRADALPRLLGFLRGRFGGLVVYPLYPREHMPATRILIQGRKGSRAPLRLMRGMVLHGAGNAFTAEAEPILRNGSGLELAPAE